MWSNRRACGQRSPQGIDHLVSQLGTLVVRSVVQQRRAAGDVVERQHRFGRRVRRVHLAAGGDVFEPLVHLEVGGTHQPTREGKSGNLRPQSRCAVQSCPQYVQQAVTRRRHRGRVAVQGVRTPREVKLHRIAEADEGIPSQPLTSLHALEQKPWLEGSQLQVRRDGRVQISGYVERRLHVSP